MDIILILYYLIAVLCFLILKKYFQELKPMTINVCALFWPLPLALVLAVSIFYFPAKLTWKYMKD